MRLAPAEVLPQRGDVTYSKLASYIVGLSLGIPSSSRARPPNVHKTLLAKREVMALVQEI